MDPSPYPNVHDDLSNDDTKNTVIKEEAIDVRSFIRLSENKTNKIILLWLCYDGFIFIRLLFILLITNFNLYISVAEKRLRIINYFYL